MSAIIDISKPIRDSIPRPSREQLSQVAEEVWRWANEHAHDLEKGDVSDKFFAAAIRITSSNLKAMVKLSAGYFAEVGAIFRNLVETCVDCLWVASFLESDTPKGIKLVENFFHFANFRFVETAPTYASIAKTDIFLRDISTPFEQTDVIEDCKKQTGTFQFGDSWRFDPTLFRDEKETRWLTRTQIAADFAQRHLNLKDAPYYQNLKSLSSFAHFDPAQISHFSDTLKDRLFDRSINNALGFVFDLLVYSYKRKNWLQPKDLLTLQHKFIWFST
ncbi:MAG: hypothetical protein HY088_07050 [Ignavibacteriales bacterium]|nr:hypothetical protein [Ignavibacteriales bacterium]